LLPGSPERVPVIARYFDDAKKVSHYREYLTYTGYLDGVKVSVCSTGIGGPSTAIAVEELSKIGADTFIRVGTSGIMQQHMATGDLIVASAAVRDEGTSRQYMPLAFPAVANYQVINSLTKACRDLDAVHHVGVVHSKDSFYGEVETARQPIHSTLRENWEAWIAGGVLCSEMEAASLFVVSSVLGKRAGALMLGGGTDNSVDLLCSVAAQGLRNLIAFDGK
jgi:uridine phosphorylase